MRPIKFRAWDAGRMFFRVTVGSDVNSAVYDDEWKECTEEAVIMQFTGLLDKHGLEIYEGDVLQWTEGDGSIGVVEWWQGDVCFSTKPTLNGLDGYRCSSYEVIGNVYQNPELLTPSK